MWNVMKRNNNFIDTEPFNKVTKDFTVKRKNKSKHKYI